MIWVQIRHKMVQAQTESYATTQHRIKEMPVEVRQWAWEQGIRYTLRVHRVAVSPKAWYVSHYEIGFAEPHEAFAFKMQFG